MTLTDGGVAALARQAAELIEADLRVQVSPAADDDPYRWGGFGSGWTVRILADPTVEAWIPRDATPTSALYSLIERLTEASEGESAGRWGQAIPRCPGHRHPARVDIDGENVVLRCPDSSDAVQRIAPVVES